MVVERTHPHMPLSASKSTDGERWAEDIMGASIPEASLLTGRCGCGAAEQVKRERFQARARLQHRIIPHVMLLEIRGKALNSLRKVYPATLLVVL